MNYTYGDVIEYVNNSGTRLAVMVDEIDSDIKNGRPGFGGIVIEGDWSGHEFWGYDEQIVSVR